ncbi:hypothetical protein [Paraglaciecola psychrophila]|nr:hypothetical protein [Paraglaciecola psychrophila]
MNKDKATLYGSIKNICQVAQLGINLTVKFSDPVSIESFLLTGQILQVISTDNITIQLILAPSYHVPQFLQIC